MARRQHASGIPRILLAKAEADDLALARRRVDEHDLARLGELGQEDEADNLPLSALHEARLELGLVPDVVYVRRLEEDERVAIRERVAPCAGERAYALAKK